MGRPVCYYMKRMEGVELVEMEVPLLEQVYVVEYDEYGCVVQGYVVCDFGSWVRHGYSGRMCEETRGGKRVFTSYSVWSWGKCVGDELMEVIYDDRTEYFVNGEREEDLTERVMRIQDQVSVMMFEEIPSVEKLKMYPEEEVDGVIVTGRKPMKIERSKTKFER